MPGGTSGLTLRHQLLDECDQDKAQDQKDEDEHHNDESFGAFEAERRRDSLRDVAARERGANKLHKYGFVIRMELDE